MTLRMALEILCLTVLVLDLILTYGLIRKLRDTNTGGPRWPDMMPPEGLLVEPARDHHRWSQAHTGMLVNDQLVVLATPGCTGCSTLRREMERVASFPIPVWVLAEPESDGTEVNDYLETWGFADHRLVAPDQYPLMASMEHPMRTPVIMLLRNGTVMSRGYRYRDVEPALRRLVTV